jgi:hypothetical protein
MSDVHDDDVLAGEYPYPSEEFGERGRLHWCEFVEPDGATHGVCHLPGLHGGRAPYPEPAPVLCDPWCPGCENPIHERAAESTKEGETP